MLRLEKDRGRTQGGASRCPGLSSLFPFKIGWSAPGASYLVLKLCELRAFAVNLGR
jgi:hypothetical protein